MISVVIPAYKNTVELIHNLKHNLRFLSNCEVIVVNDDPEKSIKENIGYFKNVILIEHTKNKGFSGTANTGISRAQGSHILLLNSDVVLHDDGFKKALKLFENDPKLFAVSFAQKEKHERTVGKNKLYWKDGFMHHGGAPASPGATAWAEGGSTLIDKKKFEELRGFDTIYAPFYWEDIDLSYRAWKRGYTVLFDPSVLVTHYHGSTIGSYFASRIKTVSYRNQFLFVWKNMTDSSYLLSHILYLFPNILRHLVKGETSFVVGFLKALALLPYVLHGRYTEKKFVRISDKNILELLR